MRSVVPRFVVTGMGKLHMVLPSTYTMFIEQVINVSISENIVSTWESLLKI